MISFISRKIRASRSFFIAIEFNLYHSRIKMESSWWRNTVFYHIYLNSFKDGNNDGMGDFKGLSSSLDYFKFLGVKTLLLSPIHPSPMKDNGYDISDFMNINSIYGTLQDFDNFIKELRKRDMSVILDFVTNHTSDEHEWFEKSVNKVDPYTDYYVWVDPIKNGDKLEPPNNWLSVFNDSAWEYHPKRKQFYLHQFLKEQPDLDWRNTNVRKEMEKVLEFWLDRGVDGFRVDAICHFLEDELLRNEPIAARTKCEPHEYGYLDHIFTKGLRENHSLVKEWRQVLAKYEEKTGKDKIIVTEAYEPIEDLMPYYGPIGERLSDVPFNTELLGIKRSSSARDLHKAITSWLDVLPEGKAANWIYGNHDQLRFTSRVGPDMVSPIHMVTCLLPGILFCYYGDELGMEDNIVSAEETQDMFALRTKLENSRDPSRSPFQWDDTKLAGFTESAKPWLPIHKNSKTLNVKVQKDNPLSILSIFRQLLQLRKEPSRTSGAVEFPVIDGNIFSMIRVLPNTKSFLVVINMGSSLSFVDFTSTSKYLPNSGYLEVTNNKKYVDKASLSKDYLAGDFSSEYIKAFDLLNTNTKANIFFSKIVLLPKEGMVISFTPLNVDKK